MALTYRSSGGFAYSASAGASSVAPSYPASIAAGDLLICIVGFKPSAANTGGVSTPTGWTLLGKYEFGGGYGATLGADTGNTSIYAFGKKASGSESGTLSISLTGSNVSWANISRISASSQEYEIATAVGEDSSAGNVSVTFSGALATATLTGDLFIGAMVIPTDVTTPSQFSAEAITQTSTTFGTMTEVGEADSTTGNDIGGFIIRRPVTTGGGSGNVTMTATAGGTTTNVRGSAICIRIREIGQNMVMEKYRLRNDDGNETSATWKAAVDTSTDVDVSTPFRVRISVFNATGLNRDTTFSLYARLNGGSAFEVTDSSSVVRYAASLNVTQGANTTQQISSRSYTSGVFLEAYSLAGINAVQPGWTFEMEFSLAIQAADVADGDSISFWMSDTAGATFFDYVSVVPQLTVQEAAGPTIAPTAQNINVAPVVPQVNTGAAVEPTAKNIAVAGLAPAVNTGAAISPSAANISIAGLAPTLVVGGIAIWPPAKGIAIAGIAPAVNTGAAVSVPAAGLTLGKLAPVIASGAAVEVPAKGITVAAVAPVIATAAVINVPVSEIVVAANPPVIQIAQLDPGLKRTVQEFDPGAMVVLFELSGSVIGPDPLRFVSGSIGQDHVFFDGQEYFPVPIEAEGFEWNGKGPLPQPSLRVANIQGIFTSIVTNLDDLLGCKFRRIRTFRQFLDDGTDPDGDAHLMDDVYYLERRKSQNNVFVEFELSSLVDQEGVQLPREIALKDVCSRIYRTWDPATGTFNYTKATCPYTGANYSDMKGNPCAAKDDQCGHRLVDCRYRFGQDNEIFGTFLPGIGDQGY